MNADVQVIKQQLGETLDAVTGLTEVLGAVVTDVEDIAADQEYLKNKIDQLPASDVKPEDIAEIKELSGNLSAKVSALAATNQELKARTAAISAQVDSTIGQVETPPNDGTGEDIPTPPVEEGNGGPETEA